VKDKCWRWCTSTRGQHLIVGSSIVLPLAAAACVYGQFLNQWFVTDDFLWLKAASDPDLHRFLRGALTFPDGPTPYWRPAIDLYFFCMYRVFSLHAVPYHVASLLWHGAVAAATVLLVKRIARSLPVGLLAGVLFSVTPSYGVSVTWISGTTEVISVFFAVATVLLYMEFMRQKRQGMLLLAACTFVMSLLAKETGVVLVPMLAALSLAAFPPRSRDDVRRLALSLLPFVVLDVAFVAVQFSQVYLDSSTNDYKVTWDAMERLLDRLLWLSWPRNGPWSDGIQWTVLAMSTAASGIAFVRRRWLVPALYCCMVLALIPSSFISTPFQPRWVYFGAVFWSGLVGIWLMMIARLVSRRSVPLAALTLAVALALLGWAFIPGTIKTQRPLPAQAAQMRQIRSAVQNGCPASGPGQQFFVGPLPVLDPGYAVKALVALLRPRARVLPFGSVYLVPVENTDCIVTFQAGAYVAQPVGRGAQ